MNAKLCYAQCMRHGTMHLHEDFFMSVSNINLRQKDKDTCNTQKVKQLRLINQ